MKTSGIAVMFNDVSSVGMSKSTSKNSSESKVFDSIINMSISNRSNEYSVDSTLDTSVQTEVSDEAIEVKKDVVKEESIAKTNKDVDNKPKEEKVESKDNTESDNISKEDDSKEFAQAIEEVASQIKEKIKEILGISDEEIEELLSSTGFSVVQLLDSDNLKEFVVAYCGENEIRSILTNENVLDVYVSLENAISEIPVEEICQMSPKDLVLLADETMEFINSKPEIVVDESVEVKDNGRLSERNDADIIDTSDKSEEAENVSLTVDTNKKAEFNEDKKPTIEVTKDEGTKVDIKDEASYDASDSFKESSKEPATEKMTYDTFISNLNNVVNSNESVDFCNAMASVRTMNQIVEQIVNKIKVNISADNSTMELMLNPEKLGKLGLSVTAKEGVMTASFIVESEMAKHAIESQV